MIFSVVTRYTIKQRNFKHVFELKIYFFSMCNICDNDNATSSNVTKVALNAVKLYFQLNL